MNPESSLPSPDRAGSGKPLMDEQTSWLRLLLNLSMIPVGLLLLVPLAVLVALWFYLAACKEGVRLVLRATFRWRREASAMRVLPPPHFSETQQPTSPNDVK